MDAASEFRALLKETVAVAKDCAHAMTDMGKTVDRATDAIVASDTALDRSSKALEDTTKLLVSVKPVLDNCMRTLRDLADETRRKNDLEKDRQKSENLYRSQRETEIRTAADRQTKLQVFLLDAGEKICNILDSRWSTIAVMIGWTITMVWWVMGDRDTPPPSPSPILLPLPPSSPSESTP